MKRLLFLILLIPILTHAQRQIPTSPKWFIVDSDAVVIPAFNTIVLTYANGYNVSKVDSASDAVTYSYTNSKNEKIDVFYRFEVESFPPGKTIKYFGVTAPNDIMIGFYNGYLGTNLQSCEEVCYVNGRTFVYHDHVYIARATQLLTPKGKPNGYASVSFSDTH
jgi:hypothetical protein